MPTTSFLVAADADDWLAHNVWSMGAPPGSRAMLGFLSCAILAERVSGRR